MKRPDISKLPQRRKVALLVAVTAVFIAIAVALTVLLMPVFTKLAEPDAQARFEAWVGSLGPAGVLVMLGIQVLQIVVAVIPGEVVQVMAGVMYGTWGGLALCLSGSFVASALVFAMVRRLGRDFVIRLFGEDKLDRFSFLNDSSKLETLVFILFLIPGMPKDLLTYLVPLMPIGLGKFMLLSTIARIPGMVASTLVGSSITDANWPLIIGVFAVVIVVGGLSIWKKDAVMGWARRLGGNRPEQGKGRDARTGGHELPQMPPTPSETDQQHAPADKRGE